VGSQEAADCEYDIGCVLVMHVDELTHGSIHQFCDWPEESLRVGKPDVYSIWRGAQFLYVGISWQDRPNSKGLFGRLNSHASGRRSSVLVAA